MGDRTTAIEQNWESNRRYLLVGLASRRYLKQMLRDLRLRDFRCFDELVFEPSPGLNLIVGPNAQGKTSLLEAVCILLRLQSPRASSLAEAVRFGRLGFGLDGHWNEHHLHVKYAGSLKSFAVDSKPQSRSADYLIVARVSWISTEDIQLVRRLGNLSAAVSGFSGRPSRAELPPEPSRLRACSALSQRTAQGKAAAP